MVRCVILILLLSAMAGHGAASPARAGAQLAMPFDCGLDHGRIKLTPTAETRYPIIGAREEQPLTTCHPARPGDCHTIMVHRFDISCGGAGVAWMRVAAAIRHAGAAPAWVEDGRLNVVLPAGDAAAGTHTSCFERPAFARAGSGLERRVALARNCSSSGKRGDFDHVVLPAGFAPVGEMGARLIFEPAGDAASVQRETQASSPLITIATTVEGETRLAKAVAEDIVEPIPGLEPYDAEFEPALATQDWVTVVRTESGYGKRRDGTVAPAPWGWLLAALALATVVGLVRLRFADAWSGRFFVIAQQAIDFWNLLFSPSGRGCMSAGAAVMALLEQTEKVVAKLNGAGPLREVLRSELKAVRQRVASVEAVVGAGEDAEAKSGTLFRAIVRDLERIRRIADSAAASLSSARQVTNLPRTASEAYDVLGVNADVSEGVLKKIVDALRMSWHPDHARNEEDRRVREGRIRQINVAWELINAKRAPA